MLDGTVTLARSVYEPIATHVLRGWTVVPFVVGVELGSRVWYPMKVLPNWHNLFAGTANASGFTNGVVGFEISWNWQMWFSALTALKERL